MKKLLLTTILMFGIVLLSGCDNGNKETWQGAYFSGGTQESDLVYSPTFKNFEECKDWAISNEDLAREGYSYCSKNCNNSDDGTPVCEEVITCYDEKGRCGNYEGNEESDDDYNQEGYDEE